MDESCRAASERSRASVWRCAARLTARSRFHTQRKDTSEDGGSPRCPPRAGRANGSAGVRWAASDLPNYFFLHPGTADRELAGQRSCRSVCAPSTRLCGGALSSCFQSSQSLLSPILLLISRAFFAASSLAALHALHPQNALLVAGPLTPRSFPPSSMRLCCVPCGTPTCCLTHHPYVTAHFLSGMESVSAGRVQAITGAILSYSSSASAPNLDPIAFKEAALFASLQPSSCLGALGVQLSTSHPGPGS